VPVVEAMSWQISCRTRHRLSGREQAAQSGATIATDFRDWNCSDASLTDGGATP
jgi:hypothetical protein